VCDPEQYTNVVDVIQGVSEKSSPNVLEYMFTSIKSFVWNFANLLAIHIHMYLSSKSILIFHQMALIFPRILIVFTRQVLSIHPENENAVYQLFGNYVIFSSSRVLVSTFNIIHSYSGLLRATYTGPTQRRKFAWPLVTSSDNKFLTTRSIARPICDSWASYLPPTKEEVYVFARVCLFVGLSVC